jgi:outer membrane protein assembly factor BamE (lipoprotein component of BamABCDE complex)
MQREQVLELLGLPTLRLMGSNGGKRWIYLDADYDVAKLQGVEGAWIVFAAHTNQTIVIAFSGDGQVEYVSTR